MKLGAFWGCQILTNEYAYEMSLREVLPRFGVELVDLPEAFCCGDPVKSINDFAATYLGVRILALAKSVGLDDLVFPCNRCHFVVSEAKKAVEGDDNLKQKITNLLGEEDLKYDLSVQIWHVIDFFHDNIGVDKIKTAIERPLKGLRLASHPGCQIVRYGDLGRADNAENPRKLDELIIAAGAESVDYPEKLDCCGSALMNSHIDSALSLAGSKMKAVQNLGVDGLVVSCPDCAMMFDSKQKEVQATAGVKLDLPIIYYTQLIGLALRIDARRLGLHLNQSHAAQLLTKIPS